jgi:hypothetical protein
MMHVTRETTFPETDIIIWYSTRVRESGGDLISRSSDCGAAGAVAWDGASVPAASYLLLLCTSSVSLVRG